MAYFEYQLIADTTLRRIADDIVIVIAADIE